MTEVEKTIINNIDKSFKWIARDKNKDLFVFKNKPYKCKDTQRWETDALFTSLIGFNHLFEFISYEDKEPVKLEDLRNEYVR